MVLNFISFISCFTNMDKFLMDTTKWETSVGEESDDEIHGQDIDDEDRYCCCSGFLSKLQPRKVTSKARWNREMGMAEVEIQKGQFWRTSGIVRNGKLYYSIEEVLFLVEIGDLLLVDDRDVSLSLGDTYTKVADGKNGCSWEQFQAYKELKSLGYIVRRHGVPWSHKESSSNFECISPNSSPEAGAADFLSKDESSIIRMFNDLRLNEARTVFDVYLPNGKFRKTSPGDPSFVLCITRGYPPSKAEVEFLEKSSRQRIPMKFCHVDQGRVSFFSFDKVDLPSLP